MTGPTAEERLRTTTFLQEPGPGGQRKPTVLERGVPGPKRTRTHSADMQQADLNDPAYLSVTAEMHLVDVYKHYAELCTDIVDGERLDFACKDLQQKHGAGVLVGSYVLPSLLGMEWADGGGKEFPIFNQDHWLRNHDRVPWCVLDHCKMESHTNITYHQVQGKVGSAEYMTPAFQRPKFFMEMLLLLYPQCPFPELPDAKFRIVTHGGVNDEKQNWCDCGQSGACSCIKCRKRIQFAHNDSAAPADYWDRMGDADSERVIRYTDTFGVERVKGPIAYNYRVWSQTIVPGAPTRQPGQPLGEHKEKVEAYIDANRLTRFEGVSHRPPKYCWIYAPVPEGTEDDLAAFGRTLGLDPSMEVPMDPTHPPLAGWEAIPLLPPQSWEDPDIFSTYRLTPRHYQCALYLIEHWVAFICGMHSLQGWNKDIFAMLNSIVHYAGTKGFGTDALNEMRRVAMHRKEVADGAQARDYELCVARLANVHAPAERQVTVSACKAVSPDADSELQITVPDILSPMGTRVLLCGLETICAVKQPFHSWCYNEDGNRIQLRYFDWMEDAQRVVYFRVHGATVCYFWPRFISAHLFRKEISPKTHRHTVAVHMGEAIMNDEVGNDGFHERGFGKINHMTRKKEHKTLLQNLRAFNRFGVGYKQQAKPARRASSAALHRVTDSHTRTWLQALNGWEPLVFALPGELLRPTTVVGKCMHAALQRALSWVAAKAAGSVDLVQLSKATDPVQVVALLPLPKTPAQEQLLQVEKQRLLAMVLASLELAQRWDQYPDGPPSRDFDAKNEGHLLAILLVMHWRLDPARGGDGKPKLLLPPRKIGQKLLHFLQSEGRIEATGDGVPAYREALAFVQCNTDLGGKTVSELAATLGHADCYTAVVDFPTDDFMVPTLPGLAKMTAPAGWRRTVATTRMGEKVLVFLQASGKLAEKGKNVKAYMAALTHVGHKVGLPAKRAPELAKLLSNYKDKVPGFDPDAA